MGLFNKPSQKTIAYIYLCYPNSSYSLSGSLKTQSLQQTQILSEIEILVLDAKVHLKLLSTMIRTAVNFFQGDV